MQYITVWRRLHKKELYDMYSPPDIIWVIKSRRLRWEGHVARTGERYIHGFGGETGGKQPPERPRRRWKDNTKMGLQELGWVHGLDRSASG